MPNPTIFRQLSSENNVFSKKDQKIPLIQSLKRYYRLNNDFEDSFNHFDSLNTTGELMFLNDDALQFYNGSLLTKNIYNINDKIKTISFWVLMNVYDNEQTIYYEGFDRYKQIMSLILRNNTLIMKSDPVEYDCCDYSKYLGKFTNICISHERYKFKVYINGKLIAVHKLVDNISNLVAKFGTDEASGTPFKGKIKNIRFYNNSITKKEAVDLYNEHRLTIIAQNQINYSLYENKISTTNLSDYKTISFKYTSNVTNICNINDSILKIENNYLYLDSIILTNNIVNENYITIIINNNYLIYYINGNYSGIYKFNDYISNIEILDIINISNLYAYNNYLSSNDIQSYYLNDINKRYLYATALSGYDNFGVTNSARSLYELNFYEKIHNSWPVYWENDAMRSDVCPGNNSCAADSGTAWYAFDKNDNTEWYSSNDQIHDIKIYFDSKISVDKIEVELGSVGCLEYSISLIHQDEDSEYNIINEYEIGFQAGLTHSDTSAGSIHSYNVNAIKCNGIHLKSMKSVHYYEYWTSDPNHVKYRLAIRNINIYGHDKNIYEK